MGGSIPESAMRELIRRKPLGAAGAIVLAVIALLALVSPAISPFDPYEVHVDHLFASPGVVDATGRVFWLGTDQLGRDTLSRLLHGTRISLLVSVVSVAAGVGIGALVGVLSAYVGGAFDLVLQRLVDALMAFPALILALAVVAVAGPSAANVVIALIVLLIPGSARVVRSQALVVSRLEYITAARAVGAAPLRIVFRHVVPNCAAAAMVFATANLGYAVVVEAGLSFLGVGTPPDVPSWGSMLSVAGQKYIEVSPWLVFSTSLAVCLTVISFNLLGDALRDLLDPRLRSA